VLKSQHRIVGIPNDYHFACRPMLSPMLDPEIKGVMQVNVRKQR
jgi:hypothetical protein